MEALGINLGLLIVQIIAFTIVFLTLNAWVYKPMLDMMETRKKKISQGLEDARVAAEARANAEKDAAKIVADAQAEASKVVREATERAEVASKDVRAAAEGEAAGQHRGRLLARQLAEGPQPAAAGADGLRTPDQGRLAGDRRHDAGEPPSRRQPADPGRPQ